MNYRISRGSRLRLPCLVVLTSALKIIAVSVLLTSSVGAHEGENHGAVADDGRFTPNEPGATFPPQPLELQNIRQFGAGTVSLQGSQAADTQLQAQALRVEDPAAEAEADANVASELGARYTHLSTELRQGKWNAADAHHLVLFYSYSFDHTVRVTYRAGQIDNVVVVPASVDQPALNEAEMAAAIALARGYWVNQGNERIGSLTGYAIQTFQADGAPFPVRMAYVSFHEDSPEPPVLVNMVDLSAQQVGRSEAAE